MNYLSALLAQTGRKDEAEGLYRRILATRERVLGASHPHTMRTRTNLGHFVASRAEAWEGEQNWPKAGEAYLEAAALCVQRYGDDAPLIIRLRAAGAAAHAHCI